MVLLSTLLLLVAGFTVVACVSAVACNQTVAGILAVASILLVADGCWSLPAIADVIGVVGISAVPFDLSVAGGPAVTGFPIVDGLLAVAGVSAYHVVPILAGADYISALKLTIGTCNIGLPIAL